MPWRNTASRSSPRRRTASAIAGETSRIVEAATTGRGFSDGAASSAKNTTSLLISDLRFLATSSLTRKPAAIAPTTRLPPSTTGAATTW